MYPLDSQGLRIGEYRCGLARCKMGKPLLFGSIMVGLSSRMTLLSAGVARVIVVVAIVLGSAQMGPLGKGNVSSALGADISLGIVHFASSPING